MRTLLVSAILILTASAVDGQTAYLKPPKAVADILAAPPPPDVSLSPTRDRVLIVQKDRYPPIVELAEPMLKLAGLRINPRTNGKSRADRVVALTLSTLDGTKAPLDLPVGVRFGTPRWAPDGKRFAVLGTTEKGIGVWVCDVARAKLAVLPGVVVNAAIGEPLQWATADELLVQTIPARRGEAPAAPAEPPGPVAQESSGKAAPARTFQDLLQNAYDETLFVYYGTSQLAFVNVASGRIDPVGPPAIISSSDVSPDGRLVLLTRVNKPFSYLHTVSSFPKTVEVRDRTGAVVATVADLPLQDRVPIEGVPTGPRQVQWIPTAPAGLFWVEALDGGDPRAKAEARDAVVFQADLGKTPVKSITLQHRFSAFSKTAGMGFFPDGKRVVVKDYEREKKWGRTFIADLTTGSAPKLLFERSTQDRYGDPGSMVTRPLPNGQRVLNERDGRLLLQSEGASPKGDRPSLSRFDIATGSKEVLFQCPEGSYQKVTAVLDIDGQKLLIERESPTLAPHTLLRTTGESVRDVKLTEPRDPAPELRSAKREIIATKRADGTAVNITLHTPPGYTPGQKLPTVLYAYPTEFADAATAGQVKGSAFRFTTLTGYSHLFFLTQGYAVMEVSMPV
ncbi:MAG TPA: hypothetical protein VH092_34065, partial [Urbifossiella sp.]|nr:hypothetical protein [Urbifossiella sp.]